MWQVIAQSHVYLLAEAHYNRRMPTPFMHLKIAEAVASQIPDDAPLTQRLQAEWPAFYFGSVAPDYQAISDVAREVSHFYRTPPEPNNRAYDRMLATYPELAQSHALSPTQAVFVAGYCAHLLLDIIWFWDVLMPHFVERDGLGDRRDRYLMHNVVLTYLDRQAIAVLPPSAVTTLDAVRSNHWLPFADDADLDRWQAMLVAQLQPGAAIQTVEIYAERMGLSAEAFAARLDDPRWMQTNIFDLIPVNQIEARLDSAVAEIIDVVATYLQTPISTQATKGLA